MCYISGWTARPLRDQVCQKGRRWLHFSGGKHTNKVFLNFGSDGLMQGLGLACEFRQEGEINCLIGRLQNNVRKSRGKLCIWKNVQWRYKWQINLFLFIPGYCQINVTFHFRLITENILIPCTVLKKLNKWVKLIKKQHSRPVQREL